MVRYALRMMVFILVLGMAGVSYGASKIVGKSVDYTSQGVTFRGYLAYDENMKGKRPGVLIVMNGGGLMIMRERGRKCWPSLVTQPLL